MKKFAAVVLVLVLMLSFAASARTFKKGTSVYVNKIPYTLKKTVNLPVLEIRHKGSVTCYKVSGIGSYSSIHGYIFSGTSGQAKGTMHVFTGIDGANLHAENGAIIGVLKPGAKVTVYGYKRFPAGGKFAAVKCGKRYGYVWANLLY